MFKTFFNTNNNRISKHFCLPPLAKYSRVLSYKRAEGFAKTLFGSLTILGAFSEPISMTLEIIPLGIWTFSIVCMDRHKLFFSSKR
jgi:hypothetical protein